MPAPHGAAPAPAPANPQKKKLRATIRISIPKHRHHKIRIHGHYVSPATKSISIAITPSSGPVQHFNANLTPATNPNCKASLISPLVCTVAVSLPAGNYTGTFATYDGLLSGGGGPTDAPTGNVLSRNQSIPIAVANGAANNVNVTLDAVPTGVVLVPNATSTLAGTMGAGFTAAKCGGSGPTTEAVSVLGTDADDNFILGPGAPAPSLTLPGSPPAGFALATPVPGSPNAFTLTHAISSSPQGPATLTATVTPLAGSGGSPVSAPVPVTIAGGTNICGVITEFPIPPATPYDYNRYSTDITVGSDGNLWFAETGQNAWDGTTRVGKVTTAGSFTEYTDPNCGSPYAPTSPFATGIATGSDGNEWLANSGCNTVARVTTDGSVTLHAVTNPFGITAGPPADGALWFTECTANKIGRITTGGTITEYSTGLTAGAKPQGIVTGPDGNLWFTEYFANKIGTITTDGTITEVAIGGIVQARPRGIAAGPDNALWFTENNGNQIGRITTGGAVTEFSLPTFGYGSSYPYGITAGPDGAMWFTECLSNKIGRITTDGTITHYTVPTTPSDPQGIVAGPDGAIWFVEHNSDIIGRLQ